MAINAKIGSGTRRSTGRIRRHARVRKNVSGTTARPRLVVFRSARHIEAQVIDDTAGKTLAAASTMESDVRSLDGDKTPLQSAWANWSPSVPSPQESTKSCLIVAATVTTGVSPRLLTQPAKPDSRSNPHRHCIR